jgi:hypothetical protein
MTLPMLVDVIVRIRHEELRREADHERLVRFAQSHIRDNPRRSSVSMVLSRAAAAMRTAARPRRPQPNPSTDEHITDQGSARGLHRTRGQPSAVPEGSLVTLDDRLTSP